MTRRITQFKSMDLMGSYVLIENPGTNLLVCKQHFNSKLDDNAVFTYCYADHTAGLSFEVLCTARRMPNGSIRLGDQSKNASFKIRYDEKLTVSPLAYDVAFFKFHDRVNMIEDNYSVNDEIRAIRRYDVLDEFRHPAYPDDVLVTFVSQNARSEGIWVRTEKIMDDKVAGVLLNEPNSLAFGLHQGDLVKIIPVIRSDGNVLIAETDEILRNL